MIYSPNYPSNYDNSANVVYTITVPNGYFIHLTFLDFLSEDPYDYMAIQEGIGADAVTLEKWVLGRLKGVINGAHLLIGVFSH